MSTAIVSDSSFTKHPCLVFMSSSGSSGRVRGGPRNMKSMGLPSVAIFIMTYLHRPGGGGHGPLGPPLDPLLMSFETVQSEE